MLFRSIVQPGKALLGLALAGPTQIVAQVDERFLEQLRVGQKAVVVADAFAGQRLAATILSIAPEVDAQRGAVEVKFSLDQPPICLMSAQLLVRGVPFDSSRYRLYIGTVPGLV